MSNIWVLGDPHMWGESPWQMEVCKRIIKWIESHPYNNPDTEVIVMGDLVDKFKALPPTTGLVLSFLKAFKTKKIHLIVGNHDIDKMSGHDNQIKNNKKQLVAYSYASEMFSNCKIYEYPEEFRIGNINILALPYYIAPTHCLNDYNDLPNFYKRYPQFQNRQFDLVAGHVIDASSNLPPSACVDVQAMVDRGSKIVLGHLHTGSLHPNIIYTGSLYSLKVDEQGNRYEIFYDASLDKWKTNLLPVFCDLISIKYGDELKKDYNDDRLPVYTIYNCTSEDKARNLYGDDIFIRKTVSSWEFLRRNKELELGETPFSFSYLTKQTLLEDFEKEIQNKTDRASVEDVPLSLAALNVIKKILTPEASIPTN